MENIQPKKTFNKKSFIFLFLYRLNKPSINIAKTPQVVGVCLQRNPNIRKKGIKKKYLLSLTLIPSIKKQNEAKTKIVA